MINHIVGSGLFYIMRLQKQKNELAISDDTLVFEPKKTRLFSGFLKRDRGGCAKLG